MVILIDTNVALDFLHIKKKSFGSRQTRDVKKAMFGITSNRRKP